MVNVDLHIPKSVYKSIREQQHYHESECIMACCEWYMENHPYKSWQLIAAALYWSEETEVLEELKKRYLKGRSVIRRYQIVLSM